MGPEDVAGLGDTSLNRELIAAGALATAVAMCCAFNVALGAGDDSEDSKGFGTTEPGHSENFGTSEEGLSTGSAAGKCKQGFVWREAVSGDKVCVTSAARDQARQDNAKARERRQPGAYGPDTCVEGYVWREITPRDHVCVTPEVRQQALADSRNHAARAVK